MANEKQKRSELKSYFVKNAIPTEQNFSDLIDSMLSQADDGIFKLPDDPLSIVAAGGVDSQKKTLYLYEDYTAESTPSWVVSLNPRSDPGDASTARAGLSIGDADGESRLFIDRSTGNIGVGTVTPAARLQVVGGAIMPAIGQDESAGINFEKYEGGGTEDGAWLRYYSSYSEQMRFVIGVGNDPSDHMAIMASGRLGINTVDPGYKIHMLTDHTVCVQGDREYLHLRLESSEGNDSRIAISNKKGGMLSLSTGGKNNAMVITRDGNVGIGFDSSSYPLMVNGESWFHGKMTVTRTLTVGDTPVQRIESGQVHAQRGDSDGWGLYADQSGIRTTTRAVTFASEFADTPTVTVAVSHLDCVADRNTRISVYTESVTTSGFSIVYKTWGDSRVYGVTASWIAHGPAA